jgi:hypothetical protein
MMGADPSTVPEKTWCPVFTRWERFEAWTLRF